MTSTLWIAVGLTALFVTMDGLLFAANARKILDGGWLPLLVVLVSFTLLMTWNRGRELVTAARREDEGSFRTYVRAIHAMDRPLSECPGPRCSTTPIPTPHRWRYERTSNTTTRCTRAS